MITIPFDLERAKRIQAGEEPGKIVTRNGLDVRVVCWDLQKEKFPIIAAISQDGDEDIYYRTAEGRVRSYGRIESDCDLILQVPVYAQYKDGDILTTKKGSCFVLNKNESHKTSFYVGLFSNMLMFECAAFIVRIEETSYATEEQKQQLINALKKSTDPRAKQYLKRFFGIEEKHKFEPFDKVLVRDNDKKWCTDFFSHFDSEEKYQPFICVGGMADECIPYNEQTKHLLGTTDNWEE